MFLFFFFSFSPAATVRHKRSPSLSNRSRLLRSASWSVRCARSRHQGEGERRKNETADQDQVADIQSASPTPWLDSSLYPNNSSLMKKIDFLHLSHPLVPEFKWHVNEKHAGSGRDLTHHNNKLGRNVSVETIHSLDSIRTSGFLPSAILERSCAAYNLNF